MTACIPPDYNIYHVFWLLLDEISNNYFAMCTEWRQTELK